MGDQQYAQELVQERKERPRGPLTQGGLQIGPPVPGNHYWTQEAKAPMDGGRPRLSHVGCMLSALQPSPDNRKWKGSTELSNVASRVGIDPIGMNIALTWMRKRGYVHPHEVLGEVYYRLTAEGYLAYERLVKRSDSL
jgi:hypothetical protein